MFNLIPGIKLQCNLIQVAQQPVQCLKLVAMALIDQGRVVRKAVNANPGLKVNRSINLACIKLFFTSYALYNLRLFKLKAEGQTI